MCGLLSEPKVSADSIDHRPDKGWWFFCARDSWWNQQQREPPMNTKLAIRVREGNPDHHLWNNNGTWWCHYTEHLPDYTKRRVRRSLGTTDRAIARFLRDSVLFEVGTILAARKEGGAACCASSWHPGQRPGSRLQIASCQI